MIPQEQNQNRVLDEIQEHLRFQNPSSPFIVVHQISPCKLKPDASASLRETLKVTLGKKLSQTTLVG